MSKHTPGPWMRDGAFITNDKPTGNVGFSTICELDYCKPEGVVNSNANLISSAPDLLEACKEAYNHISGQPNHCMRSIIRNTLEKAIVKATGKEC